MATVDADSGTELRRAQDALTRAFDWARATGYQPGQAMVGLARAEQEYRRVRASTRPEPPAKPLHGDGDWPAEAGTVIDVTTAHDLVLDVAGGSGQQGSDAR